MPVRKYHADYCKTDVQDIITALDRGQSVSVIGPPSIGKSNLLRFLDQNRLSQAQVEDRLNPWVRYAPNSLHQGRLITVSADPNALLPSLPDDRGNIAARAWPGFELLTHRTMITPQLYPLVQPDFKGTEIEDRIADLQTRFESAHPGVTDFEDHLHAHLALRHLESIIDATLTAAQIQDNPIRIVYFLDEFDLFLRSMPEYFFVALRSIRDRFKERVMFATFTRDSLPVLIPTRERMLIMEPFVELFHDSTVYLHPFNDDDAWRMLERLESRAVSKDDHGLGLLIRASGGFAGLLRSGFKHADKLAAINHHDYAQAVGLAANRLSAEENVQEECKTLIRGLYQEEIETMYGVSAQRTNVNREVVTELVKKSLLMQAAPGGIVRVFPPVLGAYIRNNPIPPEARFVPPPPTAPQ